MFYIHCYFKVHSTKTTKKYIISGLCWFIEGKVAKTTFTSRIQQLCQHNTTESHSNHFI